VLIDANENLQKTIEHFNIKEDEEVKKFAGMEWAKIVMIQDSFANEVKKDY
jgi:hypothetical protein